MASKRSFLPKMGCWMEGYGPYCEVANFDSFGYEGEGVGSKSSEPNDGPGYASHVVCMQDKTNRCIEQFNYCIEEQIELSAKDLYPNHTALVLPGSDVSSKAYALSHVYRTRMSRELYLGFGPGPFIKGPRLISRLNPLDDAYKRLEYNPNYQDNKNHAASDTLHILHTSAKSTCYKQMSTWVNCDYTVCFCPLKKCVRCEDDLEITINRGSNSNTTTDSSVSSGKNIRRHKASVSITESTYNRMIPVIIGTGVVGGNVIEVGQGRVETVVVETDTTVEEVEIPVTSFAVSLAAAELKHLLRIWVDDKLVYNKIRVDQSPALNTTLYQDLGKYGLGDYKISFTPKVEFYSGDFGQTPFASLDTTRSPIGYRDQAVLVFRDWAFGTSSLPRIRVEVASVDLDFDATTESATLGTITHDPLLLPSGEIVVATTSGIKVLDSALNLVSALTPGPVARIGITESNDVFYTAVSATNVLSVISTLNPTALSFTMALTPQNIIAVRGKNKLGAAVTIFFAASGSSVEVIQFDGESFLTAGVVTLGASIVDAFAYNGNKSFALFVGSGLLTRINVTNEIFDFDPFNMDISEFPYNQNVSVARVVSEGLLLISQDSAWVNYQGKQGFPGIPVPDISNAKFNDSASYLSMGKKTTVTVVGRDVLSSQESIVVQGSNAQLYPGRDSFLSVIDDQLIYSADRGLPIAVTLSDVIGELNTRLTDEYSTVLSNTTVSVFGLVLTAEAGLRDLYANMTTVFNYRWDNGLTANISVGSTTVELHTDLTINKIAIEKVSAVELEFINQDETDSVRTASSINGVGKLLSLSIPFNMSDVQAKALAEYIGNRMQGRTNVGAVLTTHSKYTNLVPGDEITHEGLKWRIDAIVDDLPKLQFELTGSDYSDALTSASGIFTPNAFIADQTTNSGLEIINVPLIDDSAASNTTNFYVTSGGAQGRVEYSFPSLTYSRKISGQGLTGAPLAGTLATLPPDLVRLSAVQAEGSFDVTFSVPITLGQLNITSSRDWGKNTLIVGREIIRYDNAALSMDGLTATFTGLSRGLRNTDVFAHTHILDERVLVFDETKFVPIIGPIGVGGEAQRVKLRVSGKVSSINIQKRLTTDYILPPTLLRRDEKDSGEPWLRFLSRFWNARFIQNPNPGLILEGSADLNNFQMVARHKHTFGDPGLVTAFFQLDAPFDRALFLSNFSLTPNSYIRRHVTLGGTSRPLYRGTTGRNSRDNTLGWWAAFSYSAERALTAPIHSIISHGKFSLDGTMKSIPAFGAEFNLVGQDGTGDLSLHSRLFGFNHIAPEGYSLPEI